MLSYTPANVQHGHDLPDADNPEDLTIQRKLGP